MAELAGDGVVVDGRSSSYASVWRPTGAAARGVRGGPGVHRGRGPPRRRLPRGEAHPRARRPLDLRGRPDPAYARRRRRARGRAPAVRARAATRGAGGSSTSSPRRRRRRGDGSDVGGRLVSVPFPEPTEPASTRTEVHLRYLAYFRDGVGRRVEAMTEDEARRSRVPSGWTPLELVRHLTFMERRWFVWGFEGQPVDDPHGDEVDGRWVVPDDLATADVLAALAPAGRDHRGGRPRPRPRRGRPAERAVGRRAAGDPRAGAAARGAGVRPPPGSARRRRRARRRGDRRGLTRSSERSTTASGPAGPDRAIERLGRARPRATRRAPTPTRCPRGRGRAAAGGWRRARRRRRCRRCSGAWPAPSRR